MKPLIFLTATLLIAGCSVCFQIGYSKQDKQTVFSNELFLCPICDHVHAESHHHIDGYEMDPYRPAPGDTCKICGQVHPPGLSIDTMNVRILRFDTTRWEPPRNVDPNMPGQRFPADSTGKVIWNVDPGFYYPIHPLQRYPAESI